MSTTAKLIQMCETTDRHVSTVVQTFWIANMLFYLFLLYMVIDELVEMRGHIVLTEIYIREAIVRGKTESTKIRSGNLTSIHISDGFDREV
eukprot:SAG31_NODE_58_length_29669_cov_20.244978_7_plen_91_part_00